MASCKAGPGDQGRQGQGKAKAQHRPQRLKQGIGRGQAAVAAGGQRQRLGRERADAAAADQEGGQVLADRHRQANGQGGGERVRQHRQAQPPEHFCRAGPERGRHNTQATVPGAERTGRGQIDIGQHEDQMGQRHRGQTAGSTGAQGENLEPWQKADLRQDERQIEQGRGERRQGEQGFGLQQRQGQGEGQGGGERCDDQRGQAEGGKIA